MWKTNQNRTRRRAHALQTQHGGGHSYVTHYNMCWAAYLSYGPTLTYLLPYVSSSRSSMVFPVTPPSSAP